MFMKVTQLKYVSILNAVYCTLTFKGFIAITFFSVEVFLKVGLNGAVCYYG